MPVAERRQENGATWLAPPLAVSYNWPDTRRCGTRKRADVGRWAFEDQVREPPGPKDKLDASW
jgi:hypothetical protein